MTDAPYQDSQNTQETPLESSEQHENEAIRRTAHEKVSEYVVSWKWLIGGLVFFLAAGSAFGGLYWYRSTHLTEHVLNVARQMMDEAELLKESDSLTEAIRKKEDAANLLLNFSQSQTQTQSVKVLEQLNSVLESLYEAEAGLTARRRIRSGQIIANCRQLIQALPSEGESLKYRARIMELEWDRGDDLSTLIERAKEVLRIDRQVNGRENYDAWRYLTLAALIRLPTIGYNPTQAQVENLPPYVDELLDKVHRMRPENIEIAARYAEFVADVDRPEYKDCTSDTLRDLPKQERIKRALAIIDDMVARNPDNVDSYLVRYRFRTRFAPQKNDSGEIDSDLQTVLKIDSGNPDALILIGLQTYQQAMAAQREGNKELAAENKKKAEESLKLVVERNPHFGAGYQFLGDFYVGEGNVTKAIDIWNQGVEQSLPIVNEELIARLVISLTELKRFEETNEKIDLLNRSIRELRLMRPTAVLQIRNMVSLLTARVYAAEGAEAILRAEEAMSSGRSEEAQRLFSLAQKRTSDSVQILEKLLGSFGKASAHDYVVESSSIYSKLLPESLMLAGRLMGEQGQWDRAAFYYKAAMPFANFQERAAISAAAALQQDKKIEDAVQILAESVDRSPGNMMLRYIFTQTLFQQQMNRNDVRAQDLEGVEKQLRYLAEHRDKLPQPWTIDIRLIRLEMLKESISNDPDRILKAQLVATRKFRELERMEFPPKPDGEASSENEEGETPKTYSDDLGFLSEIAGIYSSLASLSDFDRVLTKMRELPGGEALYYTERIKDAIQRNDREGAAHIIEEAIESDQLTASQKQRFISIMQTLKEDDPNSLDKVYARLKNSYDQNPDALKPQAFFLLANMAIDRDDYDYAKLLQERLEKIEGAPDLGTMWRYIKARILLSQKEPQYDVIRQIQEEIAQRRDDWDMTYLLKAMIEERFLLGKQDNTAIKGEIIQAYQMAIRCGNTQPVIWNRLLSLFEETGRTEEAQKLQRDALVRGIRLETGPGQFPQPYQRMYTQVHKSIQNEDPQSADVVARQAIVLAKGRRENPNLIFSLNLAFGKLFLDAGILDSAIRHLEEVAKRGGTFVYPLAVCLAKDQRVDEGFTLILDEIDRMPSSMGTLIPSILVLLSQVRPSEAVFKRIDKLMLRIENGERLVVKGTVSEPGEVIDLKNRRIRSLVVRFPNASHVPSAEDIVIFPPQNEEEEEEEEIAE